MPERRYFSGMRPEAKYPRCLVCELSAAWHCENLWCWWYRCHNCQKTYDPETMRAIPFGA